MNIGLWKDQVKHFLFLAACFGALFSTTVTAALPDTIVKIKPSIVGVGSYNVLGRPQTHLKGTGFVVLDGTYIVTNQHVVSPIETLEKEELVIFVGQGFNPDVYKVSVVARDESRDIAILKHTGKKLPALRFSDTKVREGETIAFTGYPIGAILGFYPVTHQGIVSSITPVAIPADNSKKLSASVLKRLKDPFMVYQLDATAYPGNSGSPVFDMQSGAVIGVVNKVFVKESKEAVLEKPSGITYVIPSVEIEAVLRDAGLMQ
ncbi:MAG: trypsin-like peptidase domain-containing protein [Hahellaceae bacterium]|nr:trypsin-like peptidase domain-containing protein [Hahellaceae bacterium]MCP5213119.1 trypsin-like peptidase domain-containing protein [Hahellaceae bacterium]